VNWYAYVGNRPTMDPEGLKKDSFERAKDKCLCNWQKQRKRCYRNWRNDLAACAAEYAVCIRIIGEPRICLIAASVCALEADARMNDCIWDAFYDLLDCIEDAAEEPG